MALSLRTRGLAPVLAAALAAVANAQMAPLQSPTKVPAAPPANALLPGGSFETPSGPAGPPVAPYHSYLSFTSENGWDYGHASGVAHRLSGFVNLADLSAIHGDRVAFVQGETSWLRTSVTLPFDAANVGPWRLVYTMANRVDAGTTVNLPFVEVWINGHPVAAEAPRHTDFRTYTTRVALAKHVGTALELDIEFRRVADPATGQPTVGTVFFDEVRLELVPPWGLASSWSPSGVPTTSDRVEIPSGSAIAMHGTCLAQWVHVNGELVAVDYPDQPTTLDTHWVAVVGDGASFEVGRSGAPFENEFVLTLLGSPGASGFSAGTKFLMSMMGGRIDLHGTPKIPWTRLVATANASDTSFDVADASGWEPGDVLVVTSSTFDRDATQWVDHAEKVVIDTVTPITGGHRVDFVASPPDDAAVGALAHIHLGGANAVTDLAVSGATSDMPTELDQSAEVANLTRNVVVCGGPPADDSEVDFGGHVMVMRCPTCGGAGEGRFSYVELSRMGQETLLGRYPIHFHMLKDAGAGLFVEGCAIHDTFNRAITIHGTDSVRVEDNVVYRAQGHAVFLEEGSEMFNELRRNLVISTLKPPPGEQTIPSDNSVDTFQDRSPSAYWITNPYNVFEDNVAAGTEGTGFWLIFPREVLGLSKAEQDLLARVPPYRMPFMLDAEGKSLFRGNRAHCCRLGFDINDTVPDATLGDSQSMLVEGVRRNFAWQPSRPANPADDVWDATVDRVDSRETVLDFVTYGCDGGLYASTGGDQVVYERLVVADCTRGTDFAAYHEVRKGVLIERAKLDTINWTGHPNLNKWGFALYDGAGRYVDVAFFGYCGTPGNTGTLIFPRGGAVNHPNHLLDDVWYLDASGSAASPFLSWPAVMPYVTQGTVAGYANVTQAYTTVPVTDPQNPLAPSKWGGIVYDETGELTGQPGHSLVRDVPILRTTHPDETPWVEPGMAATQVVVSPHRFGHLRLLYTDVPTTTTQECDLVVHRTKHTNLIWQGSFPAGTNPVGHDHVYNSRQYKQIPIIVQAAPIDAPLPTPYFYVYTLDHHLSNFLTHFDAFELTVDDALEGEEVIFRLPDLDSRSATQLTATHVGDGSPVPEHTTISAFLGDDEPCLFFDTTAGPNRWWLRVPIRAPGTDTQPGSEPAGVRLYDPLKGAHSANLSDSRWRSESIRFEWN